MTDAMSVVSLYVREVVRSCRRALNDLLEMAKAYGYRTTIEAIEQAAIVNVPCHMTVGDGPTRIVWVQTSLCCDRLTTPFTKHQATTNWRPSYEHQVINSKDKICGEPVCRTIMLSQATQAYASPTSFMWYSF